MAKKFCPVCKALLRNRWGWLYASWPFHQKCPHCNSRLRLDISRTHSFLAQIAGQLVILSGVLHGINHNSYTLAGIGFATGFAIMLLPARFSGLRKIA